MDSDAAQAAWHQHDLEEAYVRHELAKAAELAARYGGCMENKDSIEHALLVVAKLEGFNLAA